MILAAILALLGQSEGSPKCGLRTVNQVYQWSVLHYAVPADFVPDPSYQQKKALIVGVQATPSALVLTTPRLFTITPATLSTVPLPSGDGSASPVLQPYPDLAWNTLNGNNTNCNRTLVSVERTARDSCNRLWAIDSGRVLPSPSSSQAVCPPKIVVFDLNTNLAVRIIQIPSSVITPVSLLANIRLDNVTNTPGSSSSCDNMFAYIADNFAPAVVVYKSPENTFYRISHPSMYPDPDYYTLEVEGEKFRYFQGIIATDVGRAGLERRFYYSASAGADVYYMPTSALQRPPPPDASRLPVTLAFTKSSPGGGLGVDEADGCVIFNPITQGTLVSWNPISRLQRTFSTDSNIIKIVSNLNQWNRTTTYAVSVRAQRYINGDVNTSEINMRILRINMLTTF